MHKVEGGGAPEFPIEDQMIMANIVRSAATGALALAAVSAIAIPEALAQEPKGVQASPVQAVTGSVQRITLTMGEGGLFQTSAPYAKISVTDDKIVEVTPQSDRELVVDPKAIGATNVFIFDEKNMLIARLEINVVGKFAKAPDVRQETSENAPGNVRVYNRIYDARGALAKPALYQCNHRNCENVSEAEAGLAPTETTTPSPKAGATTDNAKPQ